MSLMPGDRLGGYEMVAPLGAGGMGQVYKARDTRLDRYVAVKVLPDGFAGDPASRARFEREARAISQLDHPHICALYDVGTHDDTAYLVMQFVEGETLAARLARGPLPLDDALRLSLQIADAIDAAHARGIIHRDLKPANIMVTPAGAAKVLDFGLAKNQSTTSTLSNGPTVLEATREGVILGTAAYMSPEQARGQPVDARADIWAFGVVVFEMLSGRRAFGPWVRTTTPPGTPPGADGHALSDVLASVLRDTPSFDALPPGAPPAIRRLLRRALEKDPRRRLASMADARLEIEEAIADPTPGTATPPNRSRLGLRGIGIAVGVGVVAFAAGASLLRWTSASPAPAPVARFSFALDEGQQFLTAGSGRQLFAVSPDGTSIVYEADGRLFHRAMADFEARPLTGVGDAASRINSPVFSPDGQAVAFHHGSRLSRIAITGGSVTTLCEIRNPYDVMWDREWIFFTAGLGAPGPDGSARGAVRLMRVPANGGEPREILKVDDGEFISHADILPGAEHVLLTIATAAPGSGAAEAAIPWDASRIVIHTFASGQRTTLVENATDGRYLPTGHLVFARDGVVYAAVFDPGREKTPEAPVPVIEGVRRGSRGRAWWTASASGTLVYLPGPVSTARRAFRMALMDRQGRTDVLSPLPIMEYVAPRVSPDGTRVAVGVNDSAGSHVWIYDLAGTSAMRKLTLTGSNRDPVWSPGSDRVAFQSDRAGDLALYAQRADGTGAAERLTTPGQGTAHFPESWSPDGKWLLFSASTAGRASLHLLSLGDRKVAPFEGAHRKSSRMTGAFSPDGRWVAHSGGGGLDTGQLFVEPFPQTGAKYEVARGNQAFWSRDGQELFFIPGSRRFSMVTVTTAPRFSSGQSVVLPRGEFIDLGPSAGMNLGIGPDDQQFIVIVEANLALSQARPRINVVLNWFRELNERVPSG